MKANEFVKKFGIEHAKYLIEDTTLEYFAIHSNCAGKHYMDTVCVSDLKRLVESHELVEKLGGLDEAKIYVPDGYKSDRLKQAIADVESCHVD